MKRKFSNRPEELPRYENMRTKIFGYDWKALQAGQKITATELRALIQGLKNAFRQY